MNRIRFEKARLTSISTRRDRMWRRATLLTLLLAPCAWMASGGVAHAGEPDWEKLVHAIVEAEIPGDIERFADLPEWVQKIESNACGRPNIADPGERWEGGCVKTFEYPGRQLIRAGADGDLAWIAQRVGGFAVRLNFTLMYRLSDSEVGSCSLPILHGPPEGQTPSHEEMSRFSPRYCRVVPIPLEESSGSRNRLCTVLPVPK